LHPSLLCVTADLSVYVPDACQQPGSACPVMFWIFGGGWVIGDATEFGWYEGTYLTTHHDVILVSPNYRVGPFGFMALNSLRSQDPNNSTGNAGLQDQTMALRWVHENIASFGASGAAPASAARGCACPRRGLRFRLVQLRPCLLLERAAL